MKKIFHIDNEKSDNSPQVLSVKMGDKYGSFAITGQSGNALHQLVYCTNDKWCEEDLAEFMEPVLENSFSKVLVGYDSPQSILITSTDYKQEDAGILLKTTGDKSENSNIVTDLITEWQLYNIYSPPEETREWFQKKFPSAGCWHHNTVGIKNITSSGKQGCIAVDFRTDDLAVIVSRGSKFLLAKTFEYNSPGDVLYYLLRTCQQFSLLQQEVQVRLSGLIDKQSSLYTELSQYFINLDFRESNWKMSNDYPAHFFTSLNDLAKCAL